MLDRILSQSRKRGWWWYDKFDVCGSKATLLEISWLILLIWYVVFMPILLSRAADEQLETKYKQKSKNHSCCFDNFQTMVISSRNFLPPETKCLIWEFLVNKPYSAWTLMKRFLAEELAPSNTRKYRTRTC